MGKGNYRGGSTIVRLGSDWFSYGRPEPVPVKPMLSEPTRSEDPIKRQYQKALAAIQKSDPPDEPSKAQVIKDKRREERLKKKQQKKLALLNRKKLSPEEQRRLGEQRRFEAVRQKYSHIEAQLFKPQKN